MFVCEAHTVCTHEAHILETLHAKHTHVVNSSLDCITTLTKSDSHESAT